MLIIRLHPPQLQLKKMLLHREVMVLSLVVQMSTETKTSFGSIWQLNPRTDTFLQLTNQNSAKDRREVLKKMNNSNRESLE